MPRPTKPRNICHYPTTLEFSPVRSDGDKNTVIMSVDEFEVIRLIDKEGLSQEDCCRRMHIARTTVQKIYESARKKLACVLVDGLSLRIEGGEFRLCNGSNPKCDPSCYRHQLHQRFDPLKGEHSMRIAVTYENGNIFQHFGHTRQFKVYEVQDGKVIASQVVDTNGSGHGALAGVLSALHADVLICGGIGGGAQMALASAGIQLFGGVSGNADAAVDALISGNLAYNPNVRCNHHDHEHGEGHTCGSHGCGSHSCGHH